MSRPTGERRATEGAGDTGHAAANPCRQLGCAGRHASSRLAFAFDAPRSSVIIMAPASPANSRPMSRGTRIGLLAPSVCASAGSHSATGAGFIVDHVIDTAAAALDRRHRCLRRVSDVDERPHPAAADQRELALADQLIVFLLDADLARHLASRRVACSIVQPRRLLLANTWDQ